MILRCFLALACVLALGVCISNPILFPFFLFLIVGLYLGITALGIFILFIMSLFCYGKKPFEKDNAFLRFFAYLTMGGILEFFGITPVGKGLEKMPKEPCVIVCNHLSRFDPMVSFVLMPGRKLAFISKMENMRIPIAGPIIQKIGFLPLDRDNPLKAMRTIHKGAKLVSGQGFTMGIYPEGTRGDGEKLLNFKPGAFVMAKKAACPLVVCSISGSLDYKKRIPFRRSKAVFSVLEVLDQETVKEKKPEELAEISFGIIEKELYTK